METLFELLPYACVGYCAFKAGKHWALYQFGQHLAEDPDHMIKILNQIKSINQDIDLENMPEDAHPMLLERVGSELYAYDKLTGEFLAQARDLSTLMAVVGERFPNKKFFGTLRKDDSAKELVN